MSKAPYIPSEAVTSHPLYEGCYMQIAALRNADGSLSPSVVDTYERVRLRPDASLSVASFYAAIHWDIARWRKENEDTP